MIKSSIQIFLEKFGMKKFLPCLALVVPMILTACVTPIWSKEGVSSHEAVNQLAQCQYEIGLAKVKELDKPVLVNQCMYSKGFRRIN